MIESTRAEGPGKRAAIWLQGCSLRCPGCCNPEMFDASGGKHWEIDQVCAWLSQARIDHGIEGLTLLGGEPTEQAASLVPVARHSLSLGLNLMLFSGRTLEELRCAADESVQSLLALTDILVDGPFVREQPETHRRWVGSTNQRVHHLSGRTDPNDPAWAQPNTLEIRLEDSGTGHKLTVNGFPAPGLASMWKRIALPPSSS